MLKAGINLAGSLFLPSEDARWNPNHRQDSGKAEGPCSMGVGPSDLGAREGFGNAQG